MFKTRLLSGIVLVIAALVLIITGGDVLLRRMNPAHLRPVLDCLQDAGCDVRVSANAVRLRAPQRLSAFPPVRTAPYPGFPTDAQALLMADLPLEDPGTYSDLVCELLG